MPEEAGKEAGDILAGLARRRFLIAGCSAAAGAVLGVASTKIAEELVVKTGTLIRDEFFPSQLSWPFVGEKALLDSRAILFGKGDLVKIVPSTLNPFRPSSLDRPSEPSRFATGALLNLLGRQTAQELVFPAHELAMTDLSGNLTLLGGPIGNPLVAFVMGLSGRSQIMTHGQTAFEFPIYLDHGTALREFGSGKAAPFSDSRSPYWFLKVDGGRIYSQFKHGKLVETYCLITSIPNFLCTSSLSLRRRIVIIAGVNAAGTMAIPSLIQNQTVLEQLRDKSKIVPDEKGWQAILHVCVDSDRRPAEVRQLIAFTTFELDWKRQAEHFARLSAMYRGPTGPGNGVRRN